MKHNSLETEKLSKLFGQFVIPAVISMVLAGMQGMIDGIFLGQYASTNAMASVNIAIPYMQMIMGCTMIICCGTLSFLGRTLGEKNEQSHTKAQNIFRSSVIALLTASLILWAIGIFASKPLASLMGANDVLLQETSQYIFALSWFAPAIGFMLLFGFVSRLLGKPNLYLIATVVCLIANIAIDFIAIKILKLGTIGAALATGFSFLAGLFITIVPILKKSSVINLFSGHFKGNLLKHTLLNGSSEGITSIATAVTMWLFNTAFIQYAGESGVAAFTVINYIGNFVLLVMFGISDGISTLVSYNYGAGLFQRVKKILNLALLSNFIIGLGIFVVFNLFSQQLIQIFVANQPFVVEMAVQGAHLYSIAFLFNGFNIVQSGYQTSLGNALYSGIIAGSRGLFFILVGIVILPQFFDINGVWLTVPFAEIITVLVCMAISYWESRKAKHLG